MKARDKQRADVGLTELETQVIELFINLGGTFSYPRSVGQLYGMLFISSEPMSMEALIDRLGVSKGSASQGLKVLLQVGAIRTVYVPGDRRQYYQAETALRKLAASFMRDQVGANLRSIRERLDSIEQLQTQQGKEVSSTLASRIESLGTWQRRTEKLLPLVMALIDKQSPG